MMFQWTFDLTPHLKRKDMTAEQKAVQPCWTYVLQLMEVGSWMYTPQDAWDGHAVVASQYLPGQEMEVAQESPHHSVRER